MIYAFHKALGAALRDRKFPYRVTYTPFLDAKAAAPPAQIIVARARGVNEAIGPVVGPRGNPPSVLTRNTAAEIYVFAKSSKAGAHVGEHEEECDRVVDGILTASSGIVRGNGATTFSVLEARYLTAEERSALGGYVEQWPGVVYVMRIVVPRGVARVTYHGDGLPEAAIAEVDTTINVTGPGGTGDSFALVAPGATA